MAEYNRVMAQVKPDLPKVIDTEQIYVYVPKASYDQAGNVKPDRTQFVIAGDYTLTIKHFEMTDDHVAVDVKMGYKNDTAFEDLARNDFVTKGNVTGYAAQKLENHSDTDKAYVESANGRGTKLVDISEAQDGYTIAKRDYKGQIHAKILSDATDDTLVNIGYIKSGYVKKSGVPNRVYTTNATGADSVTQFSNDAVPNTMVYRAPDGSVRGAVVTPTDTTLLNNKYVSEHYIPVGSDGKIPNSYLPADIGADEIVSGYYFEGAFYSDEEHTMLIAGDPEKLYVDVATNMTYRWDATAGYVAIGSSLALGTTHDSAYYGDFGDKAYKHSQAVGNPHNTQITDITGLKTKLDTIDTRLIKTLDDGDRNKYRIAMYAKQGTYGIVHTNRNDVSLNGALKSGSFSISAGDVITMPGDSNTPIVNGVSLSSSNAEITLPLGMIIIADSDSVSFTSPDVWKITIRAATAADTLPIRIAPDDQPLSIPLRDGKGRLTTIAPSGNDDWECVNVGYWKAHYKPFNYTTISTLSSVDKGFNVEYQVDGNSAEIEIPLKGTDDIVVDIDETNKMINIHLDATVRAKLAKMLTLPAEAPAKNSIVGVGTNNAQMIMTEQEARDAISVFKTVSLTQVDYDNLAVKDNKTLYLITG